MPRKTNPKPCPNCGNADLDVGDCGYNSFNVAWVKCPKCKLETNVIGDSAVRSWNRWCRNPVGELIKNIREKAKRKRNVKQEKHNLTMEEYAVKIIEDLI